MQADAKPRDDPFGHQEDQHGGRTHLLSDGLADALAGPMACRGARSGCLDGIRTLPRRLP
jgi:hypothetical protein